MRDKFIKLTSAVAASVCCYSFVSSPITSEAKFKFPKVSSGTFNAVALAGITTMSITGLALTAQKIINDNNKPNPNCNIPNNGFLN